MTGIPELRTPRLRLLPVRPHDLPFLIALDGDPEVMRYLTGRARTPREAHDFWAPRIPGPQWIGHLGQGSAQPVGWWALWPCEGGRAELGEVIAEVTRQEWSSTDA